MVSIPLAWLAAVATAIACRAARPAGTIGRRAALPARAVLAEAAAGATGSSARSSGIAVDRQDHIWIVHRPATLLDDEKGAQKNPPETKCCTAAPPVLKFDAEGNLLASWGGAGQASRG